MLPGSVCRYVPPAVPVAQVVPTCVVEEPEDWEREYAPTQVSVVASQMEPRPFRLRDYSTGRRIRVLTSSIRGLHTLSLQHLAVRDPVLATDDATRIGSDGYLMSLRRDAGWWLSHVTSGTDCARQGYIWFSPVRPRVFTGISL